MFKYALLAAILIVFLVSVGVFFVMNDHPWFAVLMFLLAASVSVRQISGEGPDAKEQEGGE
jgi:hypothetical protein